MTAVATRTRDTVHAAYLAAKDHLGTSSAALYEKLNHIEPQTSWPWSGGRPPMPPVIDAMAAAATEVLPGLEVFYLDGNHLAATEHRLAELRGTRRGRCRGDRWRCWTRGGD